jgi:ferrochelatase
MSGTIGVILGQLGTPDAPTPGALRRYLLEFLGDPRVIEMPWLARWLLVQLIVLFRAHRSARLYSKVWGPQGSPLLAATIAQAQGLEKALGPGFRTAVGMRYGKPSVAAAVDGLLASGAERILLYPMFPQYSGTTTGSLADAFLGALRGRRRIPPFRIVPPYFAHPGYTEAVAAVAREALEPLAPPPEAIVLSFHGIPAAYAERGDPYPVQVEESARLIASALGLEQGRWRLAYQSRFGRAAWLGPPTFGILEELAGKGVRRAAVLCPGFTADCLETIEEIGGQGRELFARKAGGGQLTAIPCVNAHPSWIDGMARIAREELAGWIG